MQEHKHALKVACQAQEARARAAEEARKQEEERQVREEEDRLAVEWDLREEGEPSRERAPQQRLFLPSSDSAGSLEEEERIAGPSQDKGKGRALTSEEVQGEVTGVACDLCDKKDPLPVGQGEYPYSIFFLLTDLGYRKQPAFGLA